MDNKERIRELAKHLWLRGYDLPKSFCDLDVDKFLSDLLPLMKREKLEEIIVSKKVWEEMTEVQRAYVNGKNDLIRQLNKSVKIDMDKELADYIIKECEENKLERIEYPEKKELNYHKNNSDRGICEEYTCNDWSDGYNQAIDDMKKLNEAKYGTPKILSVEEIEKVLYEYLDRKNGWDWTLLHKEHKNPVEIIARAIHNEMKKGGV